jgi:hypothetical protein
VELPITESVCSVLEGRSLTELAAGLMGRRPTEEIAPSRRRRLRLPRPGRRADGAGR